MPSSFPTTSGHSRRSVPGAPWVGNPSYFSALLDRKPAKAATPPSKPIQNNPTRPQQLPPPKPTSPRSAKPAAKRAVAPKEDAGRPGWLHLKPAVAVEEPVAPVVPTAPRMATARDIARATVEATRPMRVAEPPDGTVAAQIIAAAARARARTRSYLPPVGSTARAILNAGRKARGERPFPE
jgi:hypothetical protein